MLPFLATPLAWLLLAVEVAIQALCLRLFVFIGVLRAEPSTADSLAVFWLFCLTALSFALVPSLNQKPTSSLFASTRGALP